MKKAFFLLSLVFVLSSCWNIKSEEVKTDNTSNVQNKAVESSEIAEKMMKEDDEMMETWEVMENKMEENSWEVILEKWDTMKAEDTMTMEDKQTPWLYVDYKPSLIWKTDKTVLFFHATYCPSCRKVDSNLVSSNIPDWLTILKTDYPWEKDLIKKYWVTYQHTFVQVDENGDMIKKWSWWTKIEDIEENLK